MDAKYQRRLQVIEQENIRLSRALNAAQKQEAQQGIVWNDDAQPDIQAPPSIAGKDENPQPETASVPAGPSGSEGNLVQAVKARQQLRNKITGTPVRPRQIENKVADAVVPQPLNPQADAAVSQVVLETPTQPSVVAPAMVALSGDEIRRLISQSQVPLVTPVERVSRISGPDFAAFRWDTGRVYGSGEQSRMASLNGFENAVQGYIAKTASRCAGQFDKTLLPLSAPSGVVARTADIACIDGDQGAAASIIFFAHDGMFYAMAHETDLDGFQTAMDHRDRLAVGLDSVF